MAQRTSPERLPRGYEAGLDTAFLAEAYYREIAFYTEARSKVPAVWVQHGYPALGLVSQLAETSTLPKPMRHRNSVMEGKSLADMATLKRAPAQQGAWPSLTLAVGQLSTQDRLLQSQSLRMLTTRPDGTQPLSTTGTTLLAASRGSSRQSMQGTAKVPRHLAHNANLGWGHATARESIDHGLESGRTRGPAQDYCNGIASRTSPMRLRNRHAF